MWSYFRLFFSNNYWALVRDPEKLFAGSEVVQRATLETARDADNHYFQRCAAEGVTRGYFEAENDANGQWSRQYADKMAGRQSDDLLLGDKIVSEAGARGDDALPAPPAPLRVAHRRPLRRGRDSRRTERTLKLKVL